LFFSPSHPRSAQISFLPTLQRFIARGQLQSLERHDNQYVLTVGQAFHEVSAEQQRAIMRRVLETVSSSDRSARLLAVKGPRGESLGVISVGSFRRNPNAL